MENCKQFISENPLHPKLRRQVSADFYFLPPLSLILLT